MNYEIHNFQNLKFNVLYHGGLISPTSLFYLFTFNFINVSIIHCCYH